MPLFTYKEMPSVKEIQGENIIIIDKGDKLPDNLKPIRVAVVNLMPNKHETEIQLLRLLGSSLFFVEVEFIYVKTHKPKNGYPEYIVNFYKSFEDIKDRKFDGMIITGAPVEQLDFTDVDYWEELKSIMDYSRDRIKSTLHICWAAQAGLYHHYGIPKYTLDGKVFGVFGHHAADKEINLLRGIDGEFFVPHSRYTEVRREDLDRIDELEILAESEEAGVCMAASKDGASIFITGHSEYDLNTLKKEYERDRVKGLSIEIPRNYFPYDNPLEEPVNRWKHFSRMLFFNWMYYYVKNEYI